MRLAAYVYPGFHPIEERDRSFYPGFTEWDLVTACQPRFPGHAQPRVPLLGTYDDRDPVEVGRRVALARSHGVDAFVYGFFWCRGKRVFQDALDLGYLGSAEGRETPFAVMWANRMPRRVLPVRRADLPVIEDDRRVPADVDDFVELVAHLAERYFHRPNYLRLGGVPYFSIFDSTFFLQELGQEGARDAIALARKCLSARGFPGLHLAAIEPSRDVLGQVRDVGFDSVTNYVLLPYWKGPFLQDYAELAARRAEEWSGIAEASGLPYHPAVSPGWDASPRAADFGAERPLKYPWSPVVVGEHPDRFQAALSRALDYAGRAAPRDRLVFVSSLNEWSEGHYLEPDTRFGFGFLSAVQKAKLGHPPPSPVAVVRKGVDTNAFFAGLDALVERALSRIATGSAREPSATLSTDALLRMALRNEIEAAEEAAIWLVTERDTEVKLALMRQCGDEAKHYRLLSAHLRSRGDDLADFDPLAKGYTPMFDWLRTLTTTVERVAAGPFAREALAQVKNRVFIDYLVSRGEEATARLYREEIQPDEAHHHALGRKLLARFAVTEDDQRLATLAVERTLSLAEELQEIARLERGITHAPGC